jgi:hypothetical protein
MPLIHIYLQQGKDSKYIQGVGDALHEALIETWGIPLLDRFQIYHQKTPEELQIDRNMWGVQRSDDLIVFHIFTSPRTKLMKLALYKRLPEMLKEKVGLRPDDAFISIFSNTREDWSFGDGRAQLLDSKLPTTEPLSGQKRPREDSLPESWQVDLNYGEETPAGKRNGRYINKADDKGDTHDIEKNIKTTMYNGRPLQSQIQLETYGFELQSYPTVVQDFHNNAEVEHIYYEEMRALVKKVSGAKSVLIFDHTVRSSGSTNLNASKVGDAAAPVPRVHCDYTAESAPRRLMQFAKTGVYSHIRKRNLTEEDIKDLASRRFAFINVWRSISDEPIEQKPLACCDTRTTPDKDHRLYELIFPDRVGENYSLKFSDAQKWYYFPRMVKDECLVFKVYDKKADGPRFTFHTAFEDPLTTASSPARKSIEIRSIAFFDDNAVDDGDCVTSEAARKVVKESNDARE